MEDKLKPNWDSRVEILKVLFKRFIEGASKLDCDNAIEYTQPMSDMLLIAVGQLQDHEEMKKIDDLINSTLNKKP